MVYTFSRSLRNRLRSITTLPFLVCLLVLLVNDLYLKEACHNWLTGKLSDFCGLYVFVSFWAALFPGKKVMVHFAAALLFVLWKSPVSQPFIDWFSLMFYPIGRVVDITDLLALAVLPLAFCGQPGRSLSWKVNPVPVALLSLFAFGATSRMPPYQRFEQPQYLLFSAGINDLGNYANSEEYEIYSIDSLVVIAIREVTLEDDPPLADDYHKAQVLKDLDLRLLRSIKEGYRWNRELPEYELLRDSLTIEGITAITLPLDSITDHLNFKNTRLHGNFTRFTKDSSLLIQGHYKNGIEDSVWTYYNEQNELLTRKYFEQGELIKTEAYEDGNLKSETDLPTRADTVRNKYFYLALIGILIVALVFGLIRHAKNRAPIPLDNLPKIMWSLVLPFPTWLLAKFLSSLIPNSYSVDFLGLIIEPILIFMIMVPVYLVIFYGVKLRSKADWIFYLLLLSLAVVFVEEWIYLRSLL